MTKDRVIRTLPTKTDRESASSLFAWEAAAAAGSTKETQSKSLKMNDDDVKQAGQVFI